MILYENMKPIEHVLLHPICILSHLMCACKHCNVNLPLYYWTHWSCWWIYHFQNTDSTRFFITKPRHSGRQKNRSGWKTPQWELWSHTEIRLLRAGPSRCWAQCKTQARGPSEQCFMTSSCSINRAKTFLRKWPIWYKRHIANVSITPVIIANFAYMNVKKHGELLKFICM